MMRGRIKMTSFYLAVLIIAVLFLNCFVRPMVMTINGYFCIWLLVIIYAAFNYLLTESIWIPLVALVGTYIICFCGELEGTVTFLTIMVSLQFTVMIARIWRSYLRTQRRRE